ncbi:MAG: hypothetical protein DDG58_00195 [Ardenticatenia bacterium]|nr:MAG: hypothetical protein DDG58_00195 [Ardenticatenia bacterium]
MFALLIARVRIDTLAEWAAIPTSMLHRDVATLLNNVVPAQSLALLSDRQTTDPVTLLLISVAFGLFLIYLVVDWLRECLWPRMIFRIKLALVYLIVGILVFGQAGLFIALRHISAPAAYAHDGGVIQTEITIHYLLKGINPYVADYRSTPMAEWGTEYRTALDHYPYLPWTFLFSTPFYLASSTTIGWFDQRFVYLMLFAMTLAFSSHLVRSAERKLSLLIVLGLNPILASDVIFGQNDSFVLFWIVLGVWLLYWATAHNGNGRNSELWRSLSMVAFGLACASKPTAWFLIPFLIGYQWCTLPSHPMDIVPRRITRIPTNMWAVVRHLWPLALTFIVITGPWFVWQPADMIEDVWHWSAGTAETSYQIRGWGFSNFILALGLVPSRLAYWPFWIVELVIAVPLLAVGLWRLRRNPRLAVALQGYAILLLGFLYGSRFLNENYLGFLLAVFTVAFFMTDAGPSGPSLDDLHAVHRDA